MTEAVIVSTARTGLAKSWKGAFNMTHGATLGGHVVQHAVERAGIDPAEVEDVLMGCAIPEGATGGNIARQIALRAGLPVTARRRHGQPLLLVAACRPSRWPRSACIAGEGDVDVAGGVECISCVQNEMNQHMLARAWLLRAQAGDLLADAADRRDVAKRYGISRERAGRIRRRKPAARGGRGGRPASSTTRSCRSPCAMGVADKETRALLTQGSDDRRRRRHPRRHHLRRRERDPQPRCPAA